MFYYIMNILCHIPMLSVVHSIHRSEKSVQFHVYGVGGGGGRGND